MIKMLKLNNRLASEIIKLYGRGEIVILNCLVKRIIIMNLLIMLKCHLVKYA